VARLAEQKGWATAGSEEDKRTASPNEFQRRSAAVRRLDPRDVNKVHARACRFPNQAAEDAIMRRSIGHIVIA
jgi:hypothetical protein